MIARIVRQCTTVNNDRSRGFSIDASSGLHRHFGSYTGLGYLTDLHQANIGSIMGILFTFGGIGGALGPWTVGMVSDQLGLQFGMASTIGYCMVALCAWSVLNRTSV